MPETHYFPPHIFQGQVPFFFAKKSACVNGQKVSFCLQFGIIVSVLQHTYADMSSCSKAYPSTSVWNVCPDAHHTQMRSWLGTQRNTVSPSSPGFAQYSCFFSKTFLTRSELCQWWNPPLLWDVASLFSSICVIIEMMIVPVRLGLFLFLPRAHTLRLRRVWA